MTAEDEPSIPRMVEDGLNRFGPRAGVTCAMKVLHARHAGVRASGPSVFEVRQSPKGRVMRKFTVVLIANVWICCGSQAPPRNHFSCPGPPRPSRSGTARVVFSSQTSMATGIWIWSRSIS